MRSRSDVKVVIVLVTWALFILITLVSCEVTQQDIERWKSTKKGPAKLTAVIIEKRYPYEIRALAVTALVEMGAWDHLSTALKRLEKKDSGVLTKHIIPKMEELLAQGVQPGELPNDLELNAKDFLYFLFDYAEGEEQQKIVDLVMKWGTADFNRRYIAGRWNLEVMCKKFGSKSADYLIEILNKRNELLFPKIVSIIIDIGTEEQKQLARQKIMELIRQERDKTKEQVFLALRMICNKDIRMFALEMAKDNSFPVSAKKLLLRAVFQPLQGIKEKTCGTPEDASLLLDIGENKEFPQELRDEAYESVRHVGIVEHVPRVLKLLGEKDNLYKATAVSIALDIGKEKAIVSVLEALGNLQEPWQWTIGKEDEPEWSLCNAGLGAIDEVKGAKEVLLKALESPNSYVRGGAANILGVIGDTSDIPLLEKLINDHAKIKGFIPDTVGAQAKLAISNIKDPNRPNTIRERRLYQTCKLPKR